MGNQNNNKESRVNQFFQLLLMSCQLITSQRWRCDRFADLLVPCGEWNNLVGLRIRLFWYSHVKPMNQIIQQIGDRAVWQHFLFNDRLKTTGDVALSIG
jgi:hypothetical protein